MSFTTTTVTPVAGSTLAVGGNITIDVTISFSGGQHDLYVRAYPGYDLIDREASLTFVSASYGAIPAGNITETDNLASDGEWLVSFNTMNTGTHTIQLTFALESYIYFEVYGEVLGSSAFEQFTPFWYNGPGAGAGASDTALVNLTIQSAAPTTPTFNYRCSGNACPQTIYTGDEGGPA